MRTARLLLLLLAGLAIGCGSSIPGSYVAHMDVPKINGEPMLVGFDGAMTMEIRPDHTFTITFMDDSLNGTWEQNGGKLEMKEPGSDKIDYLTILEDGSLKLEADLGFPGGDTIVFQKKKGA